MGMISKSELLHSKNTRVRIWPGKGPLGPNSIPGQRWPRNQSTWRGIWPRAGSIWPPLFVKSAESWPISGSSLTRNGVWPQWTLFRVMLTRVFLECTELFLSGFESEIVLKTHGNRMCSKLNSGWRIYKPLNNFILFPCDTTVENVMK